ncbi:myb/SANT-like DNA-binding domain-containing protein 3 isoform X2 [Prorops nasuta]|uniref:myb/SANT-like DNA-binding domain-containing protein 3 isoform X2 n=1 Tax=Prorops nasuta TaxID=863751 RepID=UPI0034CEE66F
MASFSLKGTRKTYSFEEREILINLINKYEDVEDKKSDPVSVCKRKSAWTQLAEEYNSIVGLQGSRSAVQLRRCWENMKACKKNREERKSRSSTRAENLSKDKNKATESRWQDEHFKEVAYETSAPPPTTVGLPPNVMFQPDDSEPFTLQSIPTRPLRSNLKMELEACQEPTSAGNCSDKSGNGAGSMRDVIEDEIPEKRRCTIKSNSFQNHTAFPVSSQEPILRKPRKSLQREEELYMLALSEAQMKVDIAATLKEEARLKLEEAHFRKEEARLRMLIFNNKLDRMKEN